MATTIAKAVVGSKMKDMTKGFEDAVGIDEKKNTADAEAAYKKELERKQEKRKDEKRELHAQKEAERQNIRAKYQLKSGGTNNKPTSNPPKQTESSGDNKCLMC